MAVTPGELRQRGVSPPAGGGGMEPPTSAAPAMRNPAPGAAADVVRRVMGAQPEALQPARASQAAVPSGAPPGPDNPNPGVSPVEPSPDSAVPAALRSRVSDRASEIVGSDSPLMRQAELHGRQSAARRGLASSSLAVGAAQEAMIGRASELARADVQARQDAERLGVDTEIARGRLGLDRERFAEDQRARRHDEWIDREGLLLDQGRFDEAKRARQHDEWITRENLSLDQKAQLNQAWQHSEEIRIKGEQVKIDARNAKTAKDQAYWNTQTNKVGLVSSSLNTAWSNLQGEISSINGNTNLDDAARTRLINAAIGRYNDTINAVESAARQAGLGNLFPVAGPQGVTPRKFEGAGFTTPAAPGPNMNWDTKKGEWVPYEGEGGSPGAGWRYEFGKGWVPPSP